MTNTLFLIIIGGFTVLLIGSTIFFVVLYVVMIRPIRQLQKTVSEMQSTAQATEKLLVYSQQEATKLSKAFSSTHQQGHWGELQLRRVVEMAGMLPYCDFSEQETLPNGQRPDMLIRLHNERVIVVDAKAPLSKYTEAMVIDEPEERKAHLHQYTKHVRIHIQSLARKEYWQHFQPAPALVVLFLPSEALFRAAIEHDTEILDFSTRSNVLLASPMTLIALLKTLAYGWSQENRARSVQQIVDQSQKLQDDLLLLVKEWNALGSHLNKTVAEFNKTANSYTLHVLPRIQGLRAFDETLKNDDARLQVQTVQTTARLVEMVEQEVADVR